MDVKQEQTAQTSSETSGKTEQTGAADSGSVQLRGKGLSDQQAALAPGAASYAVQRAALAPVQMHGGGDTSQVHEAAAHGVSGSGGSLPHLDTIQGAFGRHDVGSVQAHTGSAAQEASRSMGAEAYATGNDVAFGSAPSLHTAAHEAAHVIQQRAGVSLSGGVGQVGDSYEQHADSVADAVVSGKSAEPILDQMAGGGGGGGVQQKAVQREESAGGGGAALAAQQAGVTVEEFEAFARSQGLSAAFDQLNAGGGAAAAPAEGEVQRKASPGGSPATQAKTDSVAAPVQMHGSGGAAVQLRGPGPSRSDARNVTLPTGQTLSGWQTTAFRILLQSMPGPAGLMLLGAMEAANAGNVTIGMGVAGGIAAAYAGGSLGGGVLAAPGNKLGFYGSVGGMGGIMAQVDISGQVTVVKGGVENFGGVALAVGGSFYSGVGGGGAVLFTTGGEFLGVMVEGGPGAGFSVYAGISGTATLSEGRVEAGG